MYEEDVPVLIVGGGSVGLAAALFLSHLGVRSTVVERRPTTSKHPRARGLNYRTMELFRELNLENAVREAGAALANIKLSLLVETLTGKEIGRFGDFEDAESLARLSQLTPVKWCFCAQDELEPLLVAAAQTNGAEIRFANELRFFKQAADGVTATVLEQKTNREYKIRAEYLLATDGAHSTVRHRLNIGEGGRGTIAHYIGIYFKADLQELIAGREFAMAFVKNSAAPGTLSSVNNKDRWVFNVEYYPENGDAASNFTPEHCIELVRTMVGWPDLEVELLSVQAWEAAAKVADHYQVGRVFLAGDAVHVMPPAGAFGMNTGIQDVHNLAWKLAAVLNKQSDQTLLETYEAERRPIGVFTTEQATLRLDFRGGGKPAKKPIPEAEGSQLIDDLTMILGYRYPVKTANDADKFPPFPNELKLEGQPGTRAPHVWLEQTGTGISTLDLFGKNFVLLTDVGNVAWKNAAQEIALRRDINLDAYSIGEAGDLQNPARKWLAAYDLTSAGAVLVRPDGFVAWKETNSVKLPSETLEAVFYNLLYR